MDKNTITGILLIFAILIGFTYFNQPSKEEVEAARARQDSIAMVEAQLQQEAERQAEILQQQNEIAELDSSSVSEQATNRYGMFANAASTGEEEFVTIENNLMKVTLSTKGGKVYSVELKNYKTYLDKPLILFNGT